MRKPPVVNILILSTGDMSIYLEDAETTEFDHRAKEK